MKRLGAFLLVCVLAFSSVAALGEEDGYVPFSPTTLVKFAKELGYTTTQDWTGNSLTRALFSMVVYVDSLVDQNISEIDLDLQQNSFVFIQDDQTSMGLAYCNKNGEYKVIFFYPDSNLAVYNPTYSVSGSASTVKASMESLGWTVYTNSQEDLKTVVDIMSGNYK